MHAYLITGQNKTGQELEVEKLIKNLGAKRLDYALQKIADVRELGKFTNLAITEKTTIVIADFDRAGEEAQNAFLKNLEEPQENLSYILTAKNEESVLPTIASRCALMEVGSSRLEVGREVEERIMKFVNAAPGEKLQVTSKITKRDEAIDFVKDVLIVLHEKFKNDPELLPTIEAAANTLRNLELNGNVQIQLTNFIVNSN